MLDCFTFELIKWPKFAFFTNILDENPVQQLELSTDQARPSVLGPATVAVSRGQIFT